MYKASCKMSSPDSMKKKRGIHFEHLMEHHLPYLSKQTDSTASSPIPAKEGSNLVRLSTSMVNSTFVACDPLLLLCFENFFMTVDIFMTVLDNTQFAWWGTVKVRCRNTGKSHAHCGSVASLRWTCYLHYRISQPANRPAAHRQCHHFIKISWDSTPKN